MSANPSHLAELFARLRLGQPTSVAGATLVPIFGELDGPEVDFLEDGHTSITEVSTGGDVNLVRFEHRGARPLLLVDGEQILGAKQNRMVNSSFVIPPGEAADIPVSCVERGRWHYERPGFVPAAATLTSTVRASKLRRVTKSVADAGSYDANQSAVWSDVDDFLEQTQTFSPTAAYQDAARAQSADIEARVSTLTTAPGQVGVAVVVDGQLSSLDVFGSPQNFARAYKKVMRGAFSEAMTGTEATPNAIAVVQAALWQLASARATRIDAPGRGQSVHAASGTYAVGAIVDEGRVVHAFIAG